MLGIPTAVFGTLAAASSLLLLAFGVPSQIWKNFNEKYCSGSKGMQISLTIVYLFWTLYGLASKDKFMIISNAPGVGASLVLCWQLFLYRKSLGPQCINKG